jgi:hypothetical protein
MSGSKRTRGVLLGGALLVTVVASVWPRAQESAAPEVVAPVIQRAATTPAREQPVAQPVEVPSLPARAERQQSPGVRDLFGPKSWNPPPAPVANRKPPPPPPPSAPPFPYLVTGAVADADGVMVVFTNQQQSFVVRVGEVIERTYRVDAIDAQAVTLTYMPLGLTQRVPMGGLPVGALN